MAQTTVDIVVKTQQSALRRLDRALKGSEKNAQKLQRFLDNPLKNAFSSAAGAAESAATRIDKAFRRANVTVKKLGREVKNAGKSAANSKFTKGALAGGAFSGLPGSGLAQGVGAGLLVGGPKGAIAAGLTITTVGLAKLARNAAITASEVKRLEIALSNVAGSDTQKALEGIRGAVDNFNIPINDATKGFTQLLAASSASGLSVEETTKVFNGLAAANKALGGDTEKLNGILLAATQVFSKGKVSAEELRGQIGERLPGAVALFAKATGRTTAQLSKALDDGGVDLKDFVTFAKGLFEEYGKDAEIIAKSPSEAGARLNTALKDLNVSVGSELDELGGRFQDFATEAIKALTRVFNFLSSLGGAIEAKLGGLPVDAIENAEERLKRSQQGVQGALGIILDPKSSQNQIKNAQQGLAIFTEGVDKAKKDLAVLKGLTDETIKPPEVIDEVVDTTKKRRRSGGTTPRVRESRVPELTRELNISDKLLENRRKILEAQYEGNSGAILTAEIERVNIELEGKKAEINASLIPLAEKELKIKLAQNEAVEQRLELETQAIVDSREKERALKSLIQSEQDQIDLLQGRLNGNAQEIEDRIRIRDLAKEFVEQGLDPAKADAQAEAIVKAQRALEGQLAAAAELDALYKGIGSTIENGIINAIDTGIDALINGTKELDKALQEIAAGVLKDIGMMLIKAGISSGLSQLGGDDGVGFFSMLFSKRAAGGPVSDGTPYIVGEKGPELFVPDSAGTILSNENSRAAMNRYSPANTNSFSNYEGGRSSDGGNNGSGANEPINVNYNVTDINGMRFVTEDQFRIGIKAAAKQGADGGFNKTMTSLKNYRSTRASVGL